MYAGITMAYHSSSSQVKCLLKSYSTDCRNSLRMFYLKPSVVSVPDEERVDMIFSLKQIQEKYIEQNRPLYMVFVDFTKNI